MVVSGVWWAPREPPRRRRAALAVRDLFFVALFLGVFVVLFSVGFLNTLLLRFWLTFCSFLDSILDLLDVFF